MAVRTARAEWKGDLKTGEGTIQTESGVLDVPYDAPSRFESGATTNPEELIGAAHAGCFSMALANILAGAGHTPDSVATEARVTLGRTEAGPTITRIDLSCEARVVGVDEEAFQKHAEAAKAGCPVSRALSPEIHLEARLV